MAHLESHSQVQKSRQFSNVVNFFRSSRSTESVLSLIIDIKKRSTVWPQIPHAKSRPPTGRRLQQQQLPQLRQLQLLLPLRRMRRRFPWCMSGQQMRYGPASRSTKLPAVNIIVIVQTQTWSVVSGQAAVEMRKMQKIKDNITRKIASPFHTETLLHVLRRFKFIIM